MMRWRCKLQAKANARRRVEGVMMDKKLKVKVLHSFLVTSSANGFGGGSSGRKQQQRGSQVCDNY